ncbi:MAG: lamin tail domain-containing protein, partial [Gammaproteobacteria bacterium]|nr:lamin tail domain-containing protein [Gammaproteobacteria bacterium]NIW43437.1 deoxyribonuclease [Gammaproteobacteria bacterium]NIX56347.1 deoxyribonuclease [candidate division Zixibacteria bacterium]
SEIVVTPTEGEFIEIYNPNQNPVDLSNYYISDATFASGGQFYYNIVLDTLYGGGGFGDFHARFPDGAMIQPGEYQSISLNADADFFAEYGVMPTYEMDQAEHASGVPDTIPDMREAVLYSIFGPDSLHDPGLTNGDEVVVLYNWNGMSDLVGDVDYLLYNSGSPAPNDEAVDKTGVVIDGPDPDTTGTAYLPDTPTANQMSAPNHGGGFSVHRIDFTEGAQTTSGGNG